MWMHSLVALGINMPGTQTASWWFTGMLLAGVVVLLAAIFREAIFWFLIRVLIVVLRFINWCLRHAL